MILVVLVVLVDDVNDVNDNALVVNAFVNANRCDKDSSSSSCIVNNRTRTRYSLLGKMTVLVLVLVLVGHFGFASGIDMFMYLLCRYVDMCSIFK
jgi:hypothetical protein